MGSFGDRLRREREMRGITLDEIAESTKISRKNLESLEKEDFDSLPGGIFNKGFVRAYARYLGIDEDQAVADYSANSNDSLPPEDQFPLEIHEKPDRKLRTRRPRLPVIVAVAAVIVIVIGSTIWAMKGRQREAAGTVSAAGPAAPTSTASPQAPSTGTSSTGTQTAAAPTPSPAKAAPVAANAPAPQSAAPAKQPAQLASAAPPTVAATTKTAPPPASTPAVRAKPQPPEHTFFIIIKAKEDSWISVVADGKRVAHGTLRAEKQRFIRAGKQIIVTTGNAGGLEVSYNGKPLGVIGNESEARTLTFTPAGLAE